MAIAFFTYLNNLRTFALGQTYYQDILPETRYLAGSILMVLGFCYCLLLVAASSNIERKLLAFVGGLASQRQRKITASSGIKAGGEEEFRLAFEIAPIGMAIATSSSLLARVNQAFCNTLGYTPRELLGRALVDLTHPEDVAASLTVARKLLRGEISNCQIEQRYMARDGKVINTILQIAVVSEELGNSAHFLIQIVDITVGKQIQDNLLYNAWHHAVTRLPNRAFFRARLEETLRRKTKKDERLFAVVLLDLDGFKTINDSLGHKVGDKLLVAIARRIEKSLRPMDTLAHFGADEFAILLENLTEIKEATELANRIREALAFPFYIEGHDIFTDASIGISISRDEAGLLCDRADRLLRDADTAMYHAKTLGKARCEVFKTAMHDRAARRLQLETDLRRAISRQEFHIHYQPIISLRTGCIVGFEALLRWQHPTLGMVSPAEFIPVAEETGQIVPIGEWVLRFACRQLSLWQSKFCPDLTMSVNLSAKQLEQIDLTEQIDRIMAETGVKGRSLKLEITESAIIEDANEMASLMLAELKSRNILLCIDDFGTGYSSLSYLHRLPVNTLKIDRSFVMDMVEGDKNSEIVRTIITLSHSMGMDAIAEGVETVEHLSLLKTLNCDRGQGYFFSPALNSTGASSLLASSPQWLSYF
ncbi:MAG: EAL domain-containing protein [Oscillatoria sp. SIO1A7]|nr:EAL domain-containing protein [Oscillatoria sp. SIO1A7]